LEVWGVSWSEKKLSIEIPDPIPAVECYKPRAEQGDANALFKMGWIYDEGKGVPQDNKTALKWYTLSTKQGNALAQNNLGLMYSKRKGVKYGV
jgi:TPR repeat protein